MKFGVSCWSMPTHPAPEDHLQVLATEEYLVTLNKIFEKTLLGTKTRIFQPDGTGIQRLNQGFSYFKEWAEELCGWQLQ